jgi:hypothetical protein
MKRTGMLSERSSIGGPGRLHLDGRFLKYGEREAGRKGDVGEEMLCDIYVLRFFFGIG